MNKLPMTSRLKFLLWFSLAAICAAISLAACTVITAKGDVSLSMGWIVYWALFGVKVVAPGFDWWREFFADLRAVENYCDTVRVAK